MKYPMIGKCRFTDGSDRDVFEEKDGKQYVLDDWEMPIVGVWIPGDDNLDSDEQVDVLAIPS